MALLALALSLAAFGQDERGTAGICFGYNAPLGTNGDLLKSSGGYSLAVHGEWHPVPLFGLGLQARTGSLYTFSGSNYQYLVATNLLVSEVGARFILGRTTGPWAALDVGVAFPASRQVLNGVMESSWGAASIPSFCTAVEVGWRLPIFHPWTVDFELRGAFLVPADPSEFPQTPVFWIQPAIGFGYRF